MPALSSRNRDSVDESSQSRGGTTRAPGRSTLTSRLPASRSSSREEGTTRPPAAAASAGGERESDDPFGLHLPRATESFGPGGPGEDADVASPGTSGLTTSPELTVNIVSPKKMAYANEADFHIEVWGPPGATVVLYLTHYTKGKVKHDIHESVTIDAGGMGFLLGSIPVDNDGARHALHVRASQQPGVFSPLRVAEFDAAYETYGGGV